MVNYLKELIKKGINEVSVKNAYQSRIKSFYKVRGFGLTDGLETEQSGLNKDEMIFDNTKIKRISERIENKEYRLIMKFQALTGLRISDMLAELTKEVNGKAKYKFKKYEIKENGITKDYYYYIKDFNTQKENVKINYLFIPKELVENIKSVYPKINDLTKLDLRTLFKTKRKNRDSRIDKYDFLKKLKKVGKEIYPNSVVRTHSFRKFFATQLGTVNLTKIDDKIGTELEFNFKQHLLGHKVHYSSKVYQQLIKDINWYFELWKLIEPALSIDYEIKNVTDEKIIEIKKENQSLKNQIDILIKQNVKMNNEIEHLKDSFGEWSKEYRERFKKLTIGINPLSEKELTKYGKPPTKKEEREALLKAIINKLTDT